MCFLLQVTSDLSCSVKVHVAFGFRVGLSLELRPAEPNEVLEERDENIWDDVQVDDEYTNEVSCREIPFTTLFYTNLGN